MNLEKLAFWKFNPKSKNFESISSLINLRKLEITQSTIVSLEGIEKLKCLEELHLNYMSKLEVIDKLQCIKEKLKLLRFDHCKKISSYRKVSFLSELEEFGVNNCGSIPSLEFIEPLKKLKHVSFVHTNVIDGDLTPCLRLPLIQHVGFFNKQHYSHKDTEIESIIQKCQKGHRVN